MVFVRNPYQPGSSGRVAVRVRCAGKRGRCGALIAVVEVVGHKPGADLGLIAASGPTGPPMAVIFEARQGSYARPVTRFMQVPAGLEGGFMLSCHRHGGDSGLRRGRAPFPLPFTRLKDALEAFRETGKDQVVTWDPQDPNAALQED